MENFTKLWVAGYSTLIAYFSGISSNVIIPLITLLVIAEILDLISGIFSAWIRSELCPRIAIRGFFKKTLYFFLIATAFMFDVTIKIATEHFSIDIDYPPTFGMLSVFYLLSTELISILQNLAEVDVKIPFLIAAIDKFKEKIDGNK